MLQCEICGSEFKNNKAGQLTRHLGVDHDMSLEDYVVLTEYDGEELRCGCGYCDERPNFHRGFFRKYAKGHRSLEWRKAKYIEAHGQPLCSECGEPTGFHRGKPKEYCSRFCQGKNAGFSLAKTQEKIRKVVKEKYGVENVSHIEEVKEKISEALTGRSRPAFSDEWCRKIGEGTKRNWKDPEYREKVVSAITEAVNIPEERKARSERLKERWEDPDYREHMLEQMAQFPNRMSGLHREIREYLDLDSYGFVPEQPVAGYIVDELNEKDGIVIEINGDYVHANPEHYEGEDVIRLRGRSNDYTAAEKWESDARKVAALEDAGYTVITIWESDDWFSASFRSKILLYCE